MPGSLEATVAVNSSEIEALQAEVERLRGRCHELENDRATIRHLKTLVTELTDKMPNLARQAAREAVNELMRRRRADTFANWRTYAALLSAGAAIGALIVALFHH